MPRKTKFSFNPAVFALLGVMALAVIFGFWFFGRPASQAFRTTPLLDVSLYLENANSLRGNIYQIEGEVANSLAWSPSSGRLFAVSVSNNDYILPILVTTDFNQLNIQKGQHFHFLLEIDENGILRTKDISKT